LDRLKSNFPYDLLGKSFLMLYLQITLILKVLKDLSPFEMQFRCQRLQYVSGKADEEENG
jgi:hypothetical protein